MVKYCVPGIPVSDETLAVDVIAEIGPFNDFLAHDDTYKGMRDQSRSRSHRPPGPRGVGRRRVDDALRPRPRRGPAHPRDAPAGAAARTRSRQNLSRLSMPQNANWTCTRPPDGVVFGQARRPWRRRLAFAPPSRGATMSDSSKEIGAGRVSFLSEEQKRRIYETALGILADIGMVVLHEEGEQVMLEGGCTKDGDGLVHVPRRPCRAGARVGAVELRRLRPRRRAGHGPRRPRLVLRQRLRRDAPARPGDRRTPPRQARRRHRGGASLRRPARHRLRHVGRLPRRHGRAGGLPASSSAP